MAALTLLMIAQLAGTPACSFPGMVPQFWPAVIKKESGRDPFALHDDDEDQPYHPTTAAAAVSKARELMAKRHSVGVGLSQLTARSEQDFFRKFGATLEQAVEACPNMHVGAKFYVSGSLQIYNSGKPSGAPGYASDIIAALEAASTETLPPTSAVRVAEIRPPEPIVITPGARTAAQVPSWDVWGEEVTSLNQEANDNPNKVEDK